MLALKSLPEKHTLIKLAAQTNLHYMYSLYILEYPNNAAQI